ncbi:F-box protein at5g07610 [Phtheirospermum japonicum]|uniref:F-box protein at5g07610 n=1 Tax=Phtheirospermum japonicum TaxID=374723 RepID=A0A830BVY2_9LAMI|nr:F-box protein at5g07610 [Phtheirospermum japonicum]
MRRFWFANDDLPIVILSRLSAKTLHYLKYVSKDWLNLISGRPFIASQLKNTEPVSGFFFQEVFEWTDQEGIESISYIPVDTQTVNVCRTVLDFLPENVVILSFNNGLLCCRSCFPNSQPKIHVCNPLNKKWTTLQWPDHNISQHSSISLAFDPFQNPVDKSTRFKLVAVSVVEKENENENENENEEYYFSFDIYSSETGSWRRSNEWCISSHNLTKSKNATVDGVSYWLTGGYQILMFDPENELSWLVTAPLPRTEFSSIPETCIGESEGKLHYVIVSEDGLQLWALEDRFGPTWELRMSIALDVLESENPNALYKLSEKVAGRACKETPAWMDPLSFKDGVLLLRVSVNVYVYRFETREMKKLCHVSTLGPKSMYSPIVVPYSMSLVPLD